MIEVSSVVLWELLNSCIISSSCDKKMIRYFVLLLCFSCECSLVSVRGIRLHMAVSFDILRKKNFLLIHGDSFWYLIKKILCLCMGIHLIFEKNTLEIHFDVREKYFGNSF